MSTICVQDPNRIVFGQAKTKIVYFVDVDGVVADWMGGAASLCGLDLEDPAIRKILKKPGAEITEVVAEDILWDRINAKGSAFWAELELYPWARSLYNNLGEYGTVCFLTSPGSMPTAAIAAAGKFQWIDKHFDTENIIVTQQKQFCSCPNSVLIDDSPKKVKTFNASGGKAVLFPSALSLIDKEVALYEFMSQIYKASRS